MTVTFRPAKRENVSLLIGLAGGTGSGKTYTAMRLASGMAASQRFAVIDTENGRARHYADQFAFDCADLRAPFRPDAYADAIEQAAKDGYTVIVVDSFSHEHAGEGGLLDWHEEEFTRLGGRDTVKMTAWIKPKMAHKAMVNRLLQVNAHLILCFRAEEKIEIGKDANGKTVVRPKASLTGLDGWIPVSEKNLPYELTLSFLLTADAPGFPKPIKLQEQHKAMVPLDRPITEETGEALAAWAAGGDGGTVAPAEPEDTAAHVAEIDALSAVLIAFGEESGTSPAIKAAIARNRNEHSPAHHIEWLKRQIDKANAAAGSASDGDSESDFARRAAEAQASRSAA